MIEKELSKPANNVDARKLLGWFENHPRITTRKTCHSYAFKFEGKVYLANWRSQGGNNVLHPKGLKTLKNLYALLGENL